MLIKALTRWGAICRVSSWVSTFWGRHCMIWNLMVNQRVMVMSVWYGCQHISIPVSRIDHHLLVRRMNWLPFEAALMTHFMLNWIPIKVIHIIHGWAIFFHRHCLDWLNFAVFRIVLAVRKSIAYRFCRYDVVVCFILLIGNAWVHGWRAGADINGNILCSITKNVIVQKFVAWAVRGGIVQGISVVISVVVHIFHCAFLCCLGGLERYLLIAISYLIFLSRINLFQLKHASIRLCQSIQIQSDAYTSTSINN